MELIDGWRLSAALLVTFGLLLGAWWLARRYAPGMAQIKSGEERKLTIVEVLHLDPRRRMVMVRDGEREHVILLGQGSETLIESRDADPDKEQ